MYIQSPKGSSGFSVLSCFLLHHFPDVFTRRYLELKTGLLLTRLTVIQKFTKHVGNIGVYPARLVKPLVIYLLIKVGKCSFSRKTDTGKQHVLVEEVE